LENLSHEPIAAKPLLRGQQNTDSQLGIGMGTTKPTPVMPSPAWNIIQDGHKPDIPVQPDIPDNDTDSGTHLIFDGGELF
jgi:hypothetical protein